jgi:hypothetical protein
MSSCKKFSGQLQPLTPKKNPKFLVRTLPKPCNPIFDVRSALPGGVYFLWRLVVIATSGRRPKTLTIFGGAGSSVGGGQCFPTRWYFSTSAFDASRPLFWQREIHNLYT